MSNKIPLINKIEYKNMPIRKSSWGINLILSKIGNLNLPDISSSLKYYIQEIKKSIDSIILNYPDNSIINIIEINKKVTGEKEINCVYLEIIEKILREKLVELNTIGTIRNSEKGLKNIEDNKKILSKNMEIDEKKNTITEIDYILSNLKIYRDNLIELLEEKNK